MILFLQTLWHRLEKDDSAGLAAEITYHWMLSLVPALIFLFTLFGMFGVKTDLFGQLMAHLHRLVPAEAFKLIQNSLAELTRASSGSLALVSLLGAMWTASNGAEVVEKALNRFYRCQERQRNFWQQKLVALGIVVGMGFLLFVCANLIVFGELLFNAIEYYLALPTWMMTVLGVSRWIIPITSMIGISAFIYYVAPDYKPGIIYKRHVWRGALTFVGSWIVISIAFSLYVNNLGNFNKVYGSMGVIIILMIWLYLTSYTLLIGGEVNAMFSDTDAQHNHLHGAMPSSLT